MMCEPDQIDMMNEDELRAELRKVLQQLFELKKDNWNNVEERLPETGFAPHCASLPVLVWTNTSFETEDIELAFMTANGKWVLYDRVFEKDEFVTHWMPLPEPPK